MPSDNKQPRVYTTLSDAALHWGDSKLLRKLRGLVKKGYTGMTLGSVFGTETGEDRLADPYCRILDRLRGALVQKLRMEELIAFAFTATTPASGERERIHPGRWRVLEPNFSNNTARGSGLELFDILVTTPEQEPPRVIVEPLLTLSDKNKTARSGSEKISLSDREYQLLRLLAQRLIAGVSLMSTSEIHSAIYSEAVSSDAVYDLVRELRKTLRPLAADLAEGRQLIETRTGQGYSLKLAADRVTIEEGVPSQD